MIIRPEISADHAAIHDITKRAFAPMPFAAGNEQDLIDRFRAAGVLALSLVAEAEERGERHVVGQATFTPARAADGSAGWYALGPIAIEPARQGQGIGRALIEAGIAWLWERKAAGCVLVGNPDYYRRFGFQPFPQYCPDGEPAEYYQILPLGGAEPTAIVAFHPLFHSDGTISPT